MAKITSTIKTCAICRTRTDAVWTWQPFGPAEDARHAFTLPGNHYRGFPALTVCNDCRFRIAGRTEQLEFRYKGQRYLYSAATGEIKDAAEDVGRWAIDVAFPGREDADHYEEERHAD